MAKTERTSQRVAAIAGKVLAGAKPTAKEAKILAASVLTQAVDRKARR